MTKEKKEKIKQQRYIDMQDSCEFKIGDYVKVIRVAESAEWGWDNIWLKEMNKYVGGIYKIRAIEQWGILVNDHFFPFFVLKKVNDESAEEQSIISQLDVVDDMIADVRNIIKDLSNDIKVRK